MLHSFSIVVKILAFSQFCFSLKVKTNSQVSKAVNTPKLLILLLDGFRWDYYNLHKQHLPGFRELLASGVQVEYVEPIFPSLSLPAWTTISTGLYPAHHNILGNVMLHRADNQQPEMTFSFLDQSSRNDFWWQFAEPLWITATKAGQKAYLERFSRCDVRYQGVLPAECTGYVYIHDEFADLELRKQLKKSVLRFEQGYNLAMIHYDSIDITGHTFCPDSPNLLSELIKLDACLQEFLHNLKVYGFHETVNVVLTSDHGMTKINEASGTKQLRLADYIRNSEDIYRTIGQGPMMMIAAKEGKVESLFRQLSEMPGVSVYRKKDIPDELHFKEGKHVLDILLLAQPKFTLVRFGDYNSHSCGEHGYYNLTDMRSIFFSSGPGFKKGITHQPIRLEDQYQIFTHILGLKPRPHNGTWENVKDMFSS